MVLGLGRNRAFALRKPYFLYTMLPLPLFLSVWWKKLPSFAKIKFSGAHKIFWDLLGPFPKLSPTKFQLFSLKIKSPDF